MSPPREQLESFFFIYLDNNNIISNERNFIHAGVTVDILNEQGIWNEALIISRQNNELTYRVFL